MSDLGQSLGQAGSHWDRRMGHTQAPVPMTTINRVTPGFEGIDLVTLMDFLAFFNTSLDDNVDEVKHGFRFIVGYKGTCVIPNSIK